MTTTTTSPENELRPRPAITPVNAAYWGAAAEHRLVLPRCDSCQRLQYPPDVVCVHCQADAFTPTEMSGRGTLYSFAVVGRLFHVGWDGRLPYVVALVELDEQPGLRMLTNLVGVAPGDIEIGMPVEVTFEERPEITLPQFRPAGTS